MLHLYDKRRHASVLWALVFFNEFHSWNGYVQRFRTHWNEDSNNFIPLVGPIYQTNCVVFEHVACSLAYFHVVFIISNLVDMSCPHWTQAQRIYTATSTPHGMMKRCIWYCTCVVLLRVCSMFPHGVSTRVIVFSVTNSICLLQY